MDEREAAVVADPFHRRPGLGRVAPLEDDLGAVAPAGLDLRAHRGRRHDHHRVHAEEARSDGDRRRVVPRGDRDHARRVLGGREASDPEGRPANLVRAGPLEVLSLGVEPAVGQLDAGGGPDHPDGRRGGKHRRPLDAPDRNRPASWMRSRDTSRAGGRASASRIDVHPGSMQPAPEPADRAQASRHAARAHAILGAAFSLDDRARRRTSMPGFTPFTRNYTDLSDENGYQFEFRCDECGSGYRSEFIRSGTRDRRERALGASNLPRRSLAAPPTGRQRQGLHGQGRRTRPSKKAANGDHASLHPLSRGALQLGGRDLGLQPGPQPVDQLRRPGCRDGAGARQRRARSDARGDGQGDGLLRRHLRPANRLPHLRQAGPRSSAPAAGPASARPTAPSAGRSCPRAPGSAGNCGTKTAG